MGLHWQFGVVQNAVASGPAAVSDLYIKDDAGTGATGDGNSKFTKTIGGSATNNISVLDGLVNDPDPSIPAQFAAGDAITVGLNSGFTGTAVSYAWTITTVDNSQGLVSSLSATSATSADFDPVFTITGSLSGGEAAIYEIELEVTNAGGATSKTWSFAIMN